MNAPVSIVILAAGLGTRMKSRKAKVLHRAGGRTLIGHVLSTARRLAPPERIFVVAGHQAEQVRQAVNDPAIGWIIQAEQKGTGHALISGRGQLSPLGGLLLVLYGDCPLAPAGTLEKLVQAQAGSAGAATFTTARLEDPTGYGRVLRDPGGRVVGIVEQRAASAEQLSIREVNLGVYCFGSDLFWKHAGEIRPDNPAGEYYLTDMVAILVQAGHLVDAMVVEDPAPLLGINNRVELAAADRILRQNKVRQMMLDGVTVENPESVAIDPEVEIGIDTIVEPFARILGRTRIGEGCRIGACSLVRNSELADNVEVGPFTIVNESRIGEGARIGPYARLRTANEIAPAAQVGNFVELKNTRLGAGSKALHLAYLGDSTIGSKVNVGAGTITCNFDGIRKHATHIADGVFVGSNSTLVAPIEIGEGAYLAAGSVITDPVEKGALALGRARQVVKPGWAKKRARKD